MTTGNQRKCIFGGKDHAYEVCSEKDPTERKNILKRQFSCIICLKGNHKSLECKSKSRCRYCKGKHNVAICTNRPTPSSPAPATTLVPNAVIASQEIKPKNAAPTSNSNSTTYVGRAYSGGKVALQAAAATVNVMKERKLRVPCPSGSHRSFITAAPIEKLGPKPVRSESLFIKLFGSSEAENRMREVVEFHLFPLEGGKGMEISCFIVENIGNISNVHLEEVKHFHSHLNLIWLSDFCRNEEVLSIHSLIGADYQWEFLEREDIKKGPRGPVAIKTSLGWCYLGN